MQIFRRRAEVDDTLLANGFFAFLFSWSRARLRQLEFFGGRSTLSIIFAFRLVNSADKDSIDSGLLQVRSSDLAGVTDPK